jgi:hypothetical protein
MAWLDLDEELSELFDEAQDLGDLSGGIGYGLRPGTFSVEERYRPGPRKRRAAMRMLGKVFSRLTVIDEIEFDVGIERLLVVQCSCGSKPRAVPMRHLTTGGTKSCGCLYRESRPKPPPRPEFVGRTFGRLVVVSVDGSVKETRRCTVQCSCGAPPFSVRLENLRRGKTKSCGCWYRDSRRLQVKPPRVELVGKQYGRLTILSVEAKGMCTVRCACGAGPMVKRTRSITDGRTKSCGCWYRASRQLCRRSVPENRRAA